jgi:hypothetical protein
MSSKPAMTSTVLATALEVLPNFGIAYLVDDQDGAWAVTKSTPGEGLHTLALGQRVRLTVDHTHDLGLVSGYQTLD